MKHEFEDGWTLQVPKAPMREMVVVDPKAEQAWIDGISSVCAFLQMTKEHRGTSTTRLTTGLLMCAILGEGTFPLYRMASFDLKNLEHAINILKAVGTYSADFRSYVERAFRDELYELSRQTE